MKIIRHTFDADADAAYCYVGAGQFDWTEEVSDNILIDWDTESRPIGVEVLGVRRQIADGDISSFLRGLVEGLFARRVEAAE